MGLDMYLDKHVYIGTQYKHRNITGSIKIMADGKPIAVQFERVSEIVERVAYWRKANQIHQWFVNNVQKGEDDCGRYNVPKERLVELVDLCKKVLNKELVPEESLPTQAGFFFGSTGYDEYYEQDLKDTIEMLKPLLSEEGDFYYHSSW